MVSEVKRGACYERRKTSTTEEETVKVYKCSVS